MRPLAQRVLYLGLRPPENSPKRIYLHHPLIEICHRPKEDPEIIKALTNQKSYTHIILTSRTAVIRLHELLGDFSQINHLPFVVVGPGTKKTAHTCGAKTILMAKEATAEGVTQLLDETLPGDVSPSLFWPHAAAARTIISAWAQSHQYPLHECILYDTITVSNFPLPPANSYDRVYFTSPSTVEAWKELYGSLPPADQIESIGPITKKALAHAF